MTRKDELTHLARLAYSRAYNRGVRFNSVEKDDPIVCEETVKALQQVEREVLARCQDKIESLMEKENESTDDQVWEYRDWLKEQQKELG